MKHPSTRELFEYWNTRRGTRAAPERGEIEPGAIRRILADTFILAFDTQAGHPFRIAGTRVCAAFGRELKAEAFLDLWSADARQTVRDLVATLGVESIGVVAGVSGVGAPRTALGFELLLLPLSYRGRTDVRVLGALAPADIPYWFGTSPIARLALTSMRFLGPATPALAPADPVAPLTPSARGRLRRGLLVYDGGQA